MAAPKGNQYAVGNPNSGRPLKYDLEKEAEEMLAFSELPDSTSIYQFVNPKPYSVTRMPEFCKHSDVFAEAYSKTKERIALNRERKVHEGVFNEGIQKRYAGIYDPILHDYEEAMKDRQAERAAKSTPTTNINFTTDKVINGNDNLSKDLVNNK